MFTCSRQHGAHFPPLGRQHVPHLGHGTLPRVLRRLQGPPHHHTQVLPRVLQGVGNTSERRAHHARQLGRFAAQRTHADRDAAFHVAGARCDGARGAIEDAGQHAAGGVGRACDPGAHVFKRGHRRRCCGGRCLGKFLHGAVDLVVDLVDDARELLGRVLDRCCDLGRRLEHRVAGAVEGVGVLLCKAECALVGGVEGRCQLFWGFDGGEHALRLAQDILDRLLGGVGRDGCSVGD